MLQVTSTCNEWTQKKPAQIQKNLVRTTVLL